MPYFSERSRNRLLTCDSRLIAVCCDVIRHYDFSITCGHRGREAQEDAYEAGTSTLPWPHSRHNREPSLAVDVAPWPIDWNNEERFIELAGALIYAARERDIDLTWGGHWKNFRDLPHLQVDPRD